MLKDNNNRAGKGVRGLDINRLYAHFLEDIGIWVDRCASRIRGTAPRQLAPEREPVREREKSAAAPVRAVAEKGASSGTVQPVYGGDMLSAQRAQIASWLGSVRFRTKLFAGADEVDVWKKIGQLNKMYDDALLAERARYNALLEQYRLTLSQGEAEPEEEYEDSDEDEYSEE